MLQTLIRMKVGRRQPCAPAIDPDEGMAGGSLVPQLLIRMKAGRRQPCASAVDPDEGGQEAAMYSSC